MTDTVEEGHADNRPAIGLDRELISIDEDAGQEHFLELRFTRSNGEEGTCSFPRSLMTKPGNIVDLLLNAGAVLPNAKKARHDLVTRVATGKPSQAVKVTRRTGWRDGSFVARGWTEGPAAGTLLFLPGKAISTSIGDAAGTLHEWRKGLRAACRASDLLTFAIAVAFAGPLLDMISEFEGAAFNFHGESSTGKSLIARAMQSVLGQAAKNQLVTYDSSPTSLDDLCFAHNDLALAIDELGRAPGSKHDKRQLLQSIAFKVAGGAGKRRAGVAERGDYPPLTWKLFAVSTGEVPLDAAERLAGEQVRHIDVPVPTRANHGVFEPRRTETAERSTQTADALAAQVEAAISANYGVALRPYISRILEDREAVKTKLQKSIAGFLSRECAGSTAWERRLANKFALVRAAASLAADFGVAPWRRKDRKAARAAVTRVYRLARPAAPPTNTKSDLIRQLLAAIDGGKFPKLKRAGRLSAKDWGFRKTNAKHGVILAIRPVQFQQLCGSRARAKSVLDDLLKHGTAVGDSRGKRHMQIAVQGVKKRSRWVVIRQSALREPQVT